MPIVEIGEILGEGGALTVSGRPKTISCGGFDHEISCSGLDGHQ
jgi:hypothetical protein